MRSIVSTLVAALVLTPAVAFAQSAPRAAEAALTSGYALDWSVAQSGYMVSTGRTDGDVGGDQSGYLMSTGRAGQQSGYLMSTGRTGGAASGYLMSTGRTQ